GCEAANSSRMAIRPGVSVSATRISLRPQSASDRSATAYWSVCSGLSTAFMNQLLEEAAVCCKGIRISPTQDTSGVSAVAMEGSEPGPEAGVATLLGMGGIVVSRAMLKLPKPLQECPKTVLSGVCGVLTDIDDTLTTDGTIPPATLRALAALHDAGLPVIAITGRPMGWSIPVARDTALSAVVAENGAVALWHDEDEALVVEYAQDAATRERNDGRLQVAAQRILAEVPGATLARDSAGRVTDIAVDHGEFAHLDES